MQNHTKCVRRRWLGGGLAVAVALVGVVIVPLATAQGGPSPSPIPEACQLRAQQPEAPLKLNLVAVKRLVKTVAMEKEVFNCFDAQSRLAQIKDVETFIELVGRERVAKSSRKKRDRHRRKSPGIETVAKRVATVTCVKDITTGRVSCRTDAVQLGVTKTPLVGCRTTRGTYPFAEIEQPTHPVEMETVVLRGRLVMTLKVEKEVFECAGRIADVYLFTEIIEAVGSHTVRPVATRFQGVICFKDEPRGQIAGCRLFTPKKPR
jgi:hypothetical protein